jgi:hypothetical protein
VSGSKISKFVRAVVCNVCGETETTGHFSSYNPLYEISGNQSSKSYPQADLQLATNVFCCWTRTNTPSSRTGPSRCFACTAGTCRSGRSHVCTEIRQSRIRSIRGIRTRDFKNTQSASYLYGLMRFGPVILSYASRISVSLLVLYVGHP